MQYIIDPKNSEKYYKKYKKTLDLLIKTSKRSAKFFHKSEIPQKIKNEVENIFPKKNYGKYIDDYIFESWDLRSLLECAMNIGYEIGKNPKKRRENSKIELAISKKLDKFEIQFEKEKRSYFGFNLLKIVKINENSCKIYNKKSSGDFEEKIINIPFKKAIKRYTCWMKKIDKI